MNTPALTITYHEAVKAHACRGSLDRMRDNDYNAMGQLQPRRLRSPRDRGQPMTPAAWNDYLAGHALATADAFAGIKWRTRADLSRYGTHYARGYDEGRTRHTITH